MLEMLAAACGITGAVSTALAQKNCSFSKNYWLIGSAGFALGNVFLFQVAVEHGLSFMALTMVFFGMSSFLMMYIRASKILAIALLMAMSTTVIINFDVFNNTFKIGNDVIPSIIAVIGSFMLSAKNVNNSVLKGYVLFVLADLFYIYIGIVEHMPWFTLQTIVYLFASAYAMIKLIEQKNQKEICCCA